MTRQPTGYPTATLLRLPHQPGQANQGKRGGNKAVTLLVVISVGSTISISGLAG